MKVEESGVTARLSVSIVVYNSALAQLGRTLDALEVAARPLESVEVRVVDNASDAAYREGLEALLQDQPARPGYRVTLLRAGQNLGYGAGHNLALQRGGGQYHLVLNPDVEIAADALELGLDYLDAHPQAALLSPRASGGTGRPEFLCKRFPSVLVLALRAFAPRLGERLVPGRMASYEMRELAKATGPVQVPLASGCFMLARGAQLRDIGGFDPSWFLYFEDFDLSLRMAALGEVVYHPALHIVHHGGYAARKGLRHLGMFARSGWRFFSRYGWRWI